MGQIQGLVHVQPDLSSEEDEDDSLSDCHDSLCSF